MGVRTCLKRTLAVLLVVALVFNNGHLIAFAEEDVPDKLKVSNGFVQYSVNGKDGRFSIKTDEGVPLRDDNNSNLLFEEGKPETSFTTFKIDGEEYIYGNEYGFLNLEGSFSKYPSTIGKNTSSTWSIGDIEVTQILELLEDEDNPNVGNVRVKYKVKNVGRDNVNVGTRILLDTTLGTNDGAAVTLGGNSEAITKEQRITGEDIPQYWRSADDLFAPSVISYGFTNGWGNLKPDEMVIGHWNNLSESKWNCVINNDLDFTNKYNEYGTADSAVALYWDPILIGPNQTKEFETFYGIGNFQNYLDGAQFGVNLNAPDKLAINSDKTGYEEDTFEIIAEIDNTLPDASNLTNVTASLILEEGLELVESEDIPYRGTDLIKANEIYSAKWVVRASPQSSYTAKQFRVDVSTDNNTEPISSNGYILLPGINGEPPSIQFQNVSPNKLYYQGNKSFTIKGEGYSAYKNTGNWKMLLVNEVTDEIFQVPRDNITVDDESILVTLTNDFDIGTYKIKIEHDYLGNEEVPQRIIMTDEERYRCRAYGILYIKKTKQNNEWIYSIETASDIDELNRLKERYSNDINNDIILDINGDVRETQEDGSYVYTVYTDSESAVFNSVLQYSGQPLVIKKIDDTKKVDGIDTIEISGDGRLTVENGFTFWWWEFEMKITDEEDYSKEFVEEDDDKSNIEVEFTGLGNVMKSIAGFVIEINNALILENGVSFGGKMELSFLPKVVDDEDETASLSVDVSKILYGIEESSDKVGFIGIDTEASFKSPKEVIPLSIIEKGFEATIKINTIEDIYGLEGQVDIKICEAYVNLTIMKDTKKNRYLPDDIVLAAGFDPGYPIGTTGGFVTKIGGGVEDIFGTITGDTSMPPMQVVLMTGVNFAKTIKADVTLKVSQKGFSLDGEGEIAKMKCLEELHIALRWAHPMNFELSAKLTLFDIINGELSLYISEHNWEGKVAASIEVPKKIWLIGGHEVGSAELGASNEKIWGKIKVIGVPAGITYYWGKGVDFDVCALNNFTVMNRGQDSAVFKDDDGNGVTMVVGNNIKRIGSSNNYYVSLKDGFGDNTVLASLDSTEHYFNIKNQEIALIELKFTDAVPNLMVYRPNGTEYELVSKGENANYLVQEISAEESSLGKAEKYVFISITNPEDGQWKVVSDTQVESSLMDVEPIPEFKSISVNKLENNQLKVTWDADYTDDAFVDIYLANNLEESGVPIAQRLNANNRSTVIDIPTDVETGDYYIRASIQKTDFGYDSIYSDSTVHISDPYQPLPVTNVDASLYGNGLINIGWNLTETQDIEGYYVSVYDEKGNIIESMGHQFVEAPNTKTVIGGQYKLEGSNELTGLQPGETYKIGIVTSRKIGDEDNYSYHYSNMVFSQPIYLPEPNPATIDIQFDNSFVEGYNDENVLTKISNEDEVTLYFNANQSEVITEVFVNGKLFGERAGDLFEVNIPTDDGNYIVEFITENENGDTSSKAISFTIDKIAPILLIDSPIQGQVGENGYINVKGISEKGANITINGFVVTPNEKGVFELALELDDKFNQNIVIEARDKANNISIYETDVVNDLIKPIKEVHIKPIIDEMNINQSIGFTLTAVDEAGKEIVLENDKVEWSIIQGKGLANLTEDAILTAYEQGEVILKASYSITDDYSFEDAVSIDILESEDNSHTDNNQDNKNDDKDNDRINKELEDILKRISINEREVDLINVWNLVPHINQTIYVSNELKMNIPSDAIEQENNLLVAVVKEPEKYVGNDQNKVKLIGDIYEFLLEDDSKSFDKPIELVFKYDEKSVTNVDNIGLYYYNERFSKWQYIGGQVDTENHEVKVNIDHFSKYALLENSNLRKLTDIEGRWSEDYIYGLVSLEIINGIQKDNAYYYNPEKPITRLEFAKLIVASIGDENISTNNGTPPFIDWNEIPEWGKEYAKIAYDNKLISGIPTESGIVFDGNSYITRVQAATIIGRTIKENINYSKKLFTDSSKIPSWAAEYIDILVEKNIINGYTDNSFRPNNFITREEAAKLISVWLSSYNN